MSKAYDVVVIGAGPGGEVGAIRAAQLGLKVALVEKRAHLGGTCLNVGCIPTKALLSSAKTWSKLQQAPDLGFTTGEISYDWSKIMARKDKIVDQQRKGLRFLMKKNKVDVYEGHGRLTSRTGIEITSNDGKKTSITTKKVLLATGSKVRELPFAQSNGKNILTSDHILFIDHVPESLAVVGGGVVGTEFASMFARMGTKVTIIELFPQILPSEDGEVVKEMLRHLKKQGIEIKTSTKLSSLKDTGKNVQVSCEGQADMTFEKVLLSIGREPVTQDLGLDKVGIQPEKGGFIRVDEHYKTSADNIYAIGDIIATPALAHTASAEAHHAAEVIAGHKPPVINYDANPNAIYTYPEVASIGLTEEACKEKGLDYKDRKIPICSDGKGKNRRCGHGICKNHIRTKVSRDSGCAYHRCYSY